PRLRAGSPDGGESAPRHAHLRWRSDDFPRPADQPRPAHRRLGAVRAGGAAGNSQQARGSVPGADVRQAAAPRSRSPRPVNTATGPSGDTAPSRAAISDTVPATIVSPGRVAAATATAGVSGASPLATARAASSPIVRLGM